jgi:glutamate-5-semialdehyde dehydrogenase
MSTVKEKALRARAASGLLALAPLKARNEALLRAASLLRERTPALLEANAADLAAAGNLEPASLQRLNLDAAKVEDLARGLEALAALPDPLGRVDLRRLLDEGLVLERLTVPLGVLGVIFESRPDAAVQIGALAIKSGNAALLKGGREAAQSVALLAALLREGLEASGLPADALQLLRDRADVDELLVLDGDVDLLIPRGSSALVRDIRARTRIPVLGHAEGVCHLYLDAAADPAMAVALVRDAKLQYPAACNAVETVLIHRDCAPALLPLLAEDLGSRGAELRGCERCLALAPGLRPAGTSDWGREFGAPILALRVVDGLDGALAHIRAHGSGHTEAIVTADAAVAGRFLREVDAAGVYHNASTRFADGYRYGFGAEVGISTSRIHARGPVGLEGLVTVKYLLRGEGHCVADYGAGGARQFRHQDVDPGRPSEASQPER